MMPTYFINQSGIPYFSLVRIMASGNFIRNCIIIMYITIPLYLCALLQHCTGVFEHVLQGIRQVDMVVKEVNSDVLFSLEIKARDFKFPLYWQLFVNKSIQKILVSILSTRKMAKYYIYIQQPSKVQSVTTFFCKILQNIRYKWSMRN